MSRTKKTPMCSFCGRPHSDASALYSANPEGPRICERCVALAIEHWNEDVENTRCDVYVSPSPIHQRGVFAGEHIREGSYVGTYQGIDNGEVRDSNETYVIYDTEGDVEEAKSWRIGTNEFRFLNHSEKPNLEMDDEFHFWALRDIAPHEELTWHYGEDFSQHLKSET